jgi:hypothetical protein
MPDPRRSPIINLLITADYELFLGRNFLSHDEVLFEPTRELLDMADRIDTPVTLFADVCSVWAHRENGLDEYADEFEHQMRDAVSRGHDVQLHIHPHWLLSRFRDGEWHISTEKMYAAELGYDSDPFSAPSVIDRGVTYLNGLLQPVKSEYKCMAFRAAGLALQPRERELIAALLENGIQIDSSVAKGVRFELDTVEVDYRKVPSSANWYMSPESGIEEDSREGLFEVPVGTFRTDISTRIGFLVRRAKSVRMLRGTGISRSKRQTRWSNLRTMLMYNLRYLYTNPWFNLSCDTKGYNLRMLLDGFDEYMRRHGADDEIFLAMINHPKMMFAQQLKLLELFVTEVGNKYKDRIRFNTFPEVLNRTGASRQKRENQR